MKRSLLSLAGLGLTLGLTTAETLVPSGRSGWRYHDGAEPPAEGWISPEFDDAAWSTGKSPLGYGEDGIATELGFGGDENAKHPAAYFRLQFDAGEISSDLHYGIKAIVDDGAVFYLNGKELDRVRMREHDSEHGSYLGVKLRGADPNEGAPVFIGIRRDRLRAEGNVLAVSVHQADASSGDLFLDASLEALSLEEFGKLKRERLAFNYREDLKRIQEAYTAKVNAFYAEYQAVADKEAKKALAAKYPRPDDELAQIERLVGLYPQEAPTIDALIWVLGNARRLTEDQVDILTKHHLESEGMLSFCLYGAAVPLTLLDRLVEHSPHDSVKGAAAYSKANQLSQSESAGKRGEAKALLEKSIDWLGDSAFNGRPLAPMAKGLLFEMNHLGIGMVAPEIEGQDIDGIDFKLSDYRGKVVVIDFWGDW